MPPDGGARDARAFGYPLGQYVASAAPASVPLVANVRTAVPLPTEAQATAPVAFNEFAASRIASDGSRILPATDTERLLVRFNARIERDPNSNLLTTVVNGSLLAQAVTGMAPFAYRLTTPQTVHVQTDVGTSATPNVIHEMDVGVNYLPAWISDTIPLFGGAPFRANGARFFAYTTTSGFLLTDVRVFVSQLRA